MSDDHSHHEHEPAPAAPRPPETPLDPGSQALADALRSSFFIVKILMVALVVLFLGSGFFTVGPQERALVLRFGRPVGEGESALLGPGPHWAFPYPIDEVVKVPITELQTVRSTVGWYATTPEQEATGQEPFAGPTLDPAVDGYLLTGDLNIIHVRARLLYRIEDPVGYVFGFAGSSNLVQAVLNQALVEAAASFGVDEVLRLNQAGFRDQVKARTAALLAAHGLGVNVEQVDFERGPRPPRQTQAEFDAVTDAVQRRDRVMIDARNQENQILSRAEAEAAAVVNRAQSDRARLVENIRSEAKRFETLLPKYRKNPELFAQLHLTETLSTTLSNAQDTLFVAQRGDGERRELRILLNRPPQERNPASAQPR
jgi:membrane protease subunit HflK